MSAPSATSTDDRRRVRRQGLVVLGVMLTFVGLALVALLLPSAPGALATALPIAALAALGLWFGGILLGRGMASRPPRGGRG